MGLSSLFSRHRSDEQLLQLVAEGDEQALKALFDRYSGRVLALSRRVLSGSSEAEEVVQETFIEVWRNANRFDASKGAASSWICGIGRNRAIDRLRSLQTRDKTARDLAAEPRVSPTAIDAVSEKEVRAHVERHLQKLPAEQRRVIQLAYFDGLTQSEIAEQTGDPLGTVKGRARAALEKLAETIDEGLA